MRNKGKLAALVVSALIGGAVIATGPAGPASATSFTATEAALVTQSGRIMDAYSKMGITPADIPTESTADIPTLESIVGLTSGTTTTPTLASSRPTDCSNTGALVSYARDIAQMNISRGDTHAQSLDNETVYMYMSNFFDLPSMCADPTAYYPDWITNDDRTAYTNYLSATNKTAITASVGQLGIGLTTLVTSPSTVIDTVAGGGFGTITAATTMTGATAAGITVIQQFTILGNLLLANNTPEEIVTQMRRNLGTTFGTPDLVNAVIGTMAALAMPTVGGALIGLGLTAMSLQISGYNTFFQTAAYNALRYTTSARAANIALRKRSRGS